MNHEKIYFHADDYGVTKEQSEAILSCSLQGALNSISILPNTPQLKECLELLEEKDSGHRLRRVLHLNFVEGKPAAKAESVSDLTDETGYFGVSFGKLLQWSYCKRGEDRERLKKQLKTEIAAQLDAVTKAGGCQITAVDSHQHYHMIPLVMEALLEVLTEKEAGARVREIRIAADPLLPLVQTPSVWFRVPPINWVKWLILRIHAGRSRKALQKMGIASPVFFGMYFTCQMKQDVVEALLPKYQRYAQKRHASLELMFHPGNLSSREELLDKRSKELEEFYLSENRFAEAECLRSLKKENDI